MDPVLSAVLSSWNWRIEIVVGLGLAAFIYTAGWQRLRNRHSKRIVPPKHPSRLATEWRLIAYLGGLTLVGLALLSPLDILGGQLFYMHMIQHLLLVMLAPPLLLLANPFPFFLWGLPLKLRRGVAGLFKAKSPFRQGLRTLTPPSAVWITYTAILLGWHDPNAYNWALRNEWVHDIEHLTFFITAILFWWHVIDNGPHIHNRLTPMPRLVYLLISVPITMLTGLAIAFSSQPIYTYYTTVPRLWGFSVIEDQILGGIIMWIPGSMMYIIAALIVIARLVQTEANKEPLPEPGWATEKNMIAPGWEK